MHLYKYYTNGLRAFDGKRTLQYDRRSNKNIAREGIEATRKQFMIETVHRLDQSHLGLIMQTTT